MNAIRRKQLMKTSEGTNNEFKSGFKNVLFTEIIFFLRAENSTP